MSLIILPSDWSFWQGARMMSVEERVSVASRVDEGVDQILGTSEMDRDVVPWAGYGFALCIYGMHLVSQSREEHSDLWSGFVSKQFALIEAGESPGQPPWWRNAEMHSSHKTYWERGMMDDSIPWFPSAGTRRIEKDGPQAESTVDVPRGVCECSVPTGQDKHDFTDGFVWTCRSCGGMSVRPLALWIRRTDIFLNGGKLDGYVLTKDLIEDPESLSAYGPTRNDDGSMMLSSD